MRARWLLIAPYRNMVSERAQVGPDAGINLVLTSSRVGTRSLRRASAPTPAIDPSLIYAIGRVDQAFGANSAPGLRATT